MSNPTNTPENEKNTKPVGSFATPEQAQAAQAQDKPQVPEPKQEHPVETLVRLVDTLCALKEKDIKSTEELIKRFDRFFSLFEALAKPKTYPTPAPTLVPSPSAVSTPASTSAPSPISTPAPIAPAVTQSATPTVSDEVKAKIERLKTQLGPLAELITFDTNESTNMIIIKPKQFLGTENFAKIGAVVRQNGGMYCSAGKASHFQVPKFEAKK